MRYIKGLWKLLFGRTTMLALLLLVQIAVLMVGFAVLSFRENNWGGLVSQGLGTSMLQMGNIVKNPRIWIPPTLASAITGPIATCLFKLEMNGSAVSSGMGTCGLVGQIGVYTGWVNDAQKVITAWDWVGLVLICFIRLSVFWNIVVAVLTVVKLLVLHGKIGNIDIEKGAKVL